MPSITRRAGADQVKLIEQTADPAATTDRVLIYLRASSGGISQVQARMEDGALYVMIPKMSAGFYFRDDFINQIVSMFTTAGAGTNGNPSGDGNHIGTISQAAAAAGVDAAFIKTGVAAAQPFLFGGGVWEIEGLSRIVTLSNGVQNLTARWGFGDSSTVADHVDGVYLEQDFGVYADQNYRLCASANSVRTKVDTGIAAVAGLETHWQININAAGTLVSATINGVASANTVNTNIPTGAGRQTAGCIQLVKQLGINSLAVVHDFWEIRCDLTTAR